MNFDGLIRIDEQLAAGGVPRLSERWRTELRGFYGSGATLHAARVGRGGAKSTASVKCNVAEVLLGEWRVPPGERHWSIFVSENVDEARARLGQLEMYLGILGVPFDRTGEQILLSDLPLGFWVRPCRIGAVSGPRCVAYSIDEAAKLDVEGVNPCEEILASLRAATVTHPGARGRMYSSPWATNDHHFEIVERGTTRKTYVSIGPSWEFNPAISEAQTHELEPDPKKWSREYQAIPQSARSAAFDRDAIDRAFAERQAEEKAQRVLILDPSSGRSDAWTWGVLGWSSDARGPYLEVDTIDALTGSFWKQVSGDEIVDKLVKLAELRGITDVHADQREALMLQSAFEKRGLNYHVTRGRTRTRRKPSRHSAATSATARSRSASRPSCAESCAPSRSDSRPRAR